MKKLFLYNILFFFIATCSYGQAFKKKALLSKVNESRFYKIPITPDIVTHLNDDLSDIRIYDNTQKEIPYILSREVPLQVHQIFKEYNIKEFRSQSKCCSRLILQNAAKNKIDNISLIIKNSDVRKNAKLSGSSDNKHWYIIKNDYYLESYPSLNNTSEVKLLNFPLLDYEYYMLEIGDSGSAPLNILKAGYYDTYIEKGKFTELPKAHVHRKDSSDKKSYISISFPSAQLIDKVKIAALEPHYYFRNAAICTTYYEKGKKHYNTITTTTLRSNSDNTIELDHLKVKDFQLIIDNQDNQPLKIKSIESYQLVYYMTAMLERGKSYTIQFGDKNLSYPQYDLGYFKDSIPENLSIIKAGAILDIPQQIEKPEKTFFSSMLWVWISIFLIMSGLGYMSYKMIKEMKTKQTTDT
ncbi:hypothetical protein [Sporocytophaga myxococcoides]|uniref:hypothetical protein n=1 Tax=Sporocytophaga myxococcoides TaxID=153721 RepID=UPI00048B0234|nr:hypothetical protein [Sporocytophaga myxococcoides]